jgi:hypothetical protein
MMKKFVALAGCVFLTGCFSPGSVPCEERPPLNLPNPDAIRLDDVKFKVIHKHNADAYFETVDKNGKEPVVVALTMQDYKKMSLNLAKMKAYIKGQQKIIKLYRKYYEESTNGKGQKEK